MAKRSHTKRRKSRRGGAIADYLPEFLGGTPKAQTMGEAVVPAARAPLNGMDAAAQSSAPDFANSRASSALGMPALGAGETSTGGRRRRSRKTRRRRRGGKYY